MYRPRLRPLHAFVLAFALQAGATSLADPASVIASQGGAHVTLADIDRFAERIPPERRKGFFDSPQRIEALILNLLLQRQQAALARAAGLDKDPAFDVPSNLTLDERLARAETQHFRETLKVPDLEQLARERYLADPAAYSVPATLDVEQVLVSTEGRGEAAARERAGQVAAEARKDPAQFAALVEKYSDDSGKATSHGLVTGAGAHPDPAFAKAAEALRKPGDISPVVQTSDGFRVLKLVAREPARKKPFDEVRTQISESLTSDYVKRMVQEHVDTLRNQPIDANPDLVASLRERYAEAPSAPKAPAPAAKKATR